MVRSTCRLVFITFLSMSSISVLNAGIVADGVTLSLGGTHSTEFVEVINGGTIEVDPTVGWLNLVATEHITVDLSSSVIGTAFSYNTGGLGGGLGLGTTTTTATTGLDGSDGAAGSSDVGFGGSGGAGGAAPLVFGLTGAGGPGGAAGPVVGDEFARFDFMLSGPGAGGGGGGAGGDGVLGGENGGDGSAGERGGASIRLDAPVISVSGSLESNGGRGGNGGIGGMPNSDLPFDTGGGGGGGAGAGGGMIFLDGHDITVAGSLQAAGGAGGMGATPNGFPGVDGAAGRLKVFYSSTYDASAADFGEFSTIHVEALGANAVPEPSSLLVWLTLGLCVVGGRRFSSRSMGTSSNRS